MPQRPQALAAFPGAAGYLLMDTEAEDVAQTVALLHAGRLPDEWPAALQGVRLALDGDLTAAATTYSGAGLVDRVNRFVLAPDAADLPALRAEVGADLVGLLDALAFEVGIVDEPPAVDGCTAEIAALALAARASHALASGEPSDAVDLLRMAASAAASVSSATRAVMVGAAGSVAATHPAAGLDAEPDLRAALDLLAGTDLIGPRAELHFHLGSVLHERAAAAELPPQEAIHHYHCTLQLIDEASAPYLWASTHLNLGTAYLVMPMVQASDQLRVGIATQSLRSALRIFTEDTHPQQWASTQINLANALVYMPSTHRADNLVEAVGLYEEVLERRDGDSDPVARARLLTNLGNALAHLGVFDDAKSRLVEARYLFEICNDLDGVFAVRSILDEIAREAVPSTVAP